MPVTKTIQTCFLYRFEAGSAIHAFTNIDRDIEYNGETYTAIPCEHPTAPTFSGEPQDAEIDVTFIESTPLADLFIDGPPPYEVKLQMYEYDRQTAIATPYYRGWVVRSPFQLTDSKAGFHCKSVWHFFERESFTDSLSVLSRYSVYDPRVGIDIETLRVSIAVTDINDERDVLTVTGITEGDDWFTGGFIVAPNRDARTILKHETVSGNKTLTLNAAFPRFTLAIGFSADIYPGDDLTYDTWANKFGALTNKGEKWAGWQYTPNVDPAVRGVI